MTAREALRRIVEAEESRRERRARAAQDAAGREPASDIPASVSPAHQRYDPLTSTTAS
ncbi:MAG: hypothetical protein QN141_09480 [Armatimonadota bacterium]|nr:hypothetical protein [Armatimonadota bacterium]MDR7451745.1 hypothetical protein [Armatimonadota bacterium]MDR7467370.1 hypothetical protein [Armatimonadota bacterium]MDR7494140.1 hypothetical protein [Armatimonadota bacterium]MDR7498894.1 hypothetical protein [Armatimonadota bacterium]